jgi:hypothetical protein
MATYGTVNAENITSSTGGVISPNITSLRNRIINGAMVIDQRDAGASVTPTNGQYTLDRWLFGVPQASKFTAQQNAGSVTPPSGFINYLGITSSSAYSIVSGDYFTVGQNIEGLNITDLAWGTANAKTVTLSFQVYSSLTGTFGGSLKNSANARSYPFSYTISSANTWTAINITIVGDTSGTWLTTNGIGIQLSFGFGVGSTYQGTAGAWASANYLSCTGATSVVGTSGATFYITGVQLEVGAQATSFDYRQYGTELALCQRYYAKFGANNNWFLANNGITSAEAIIKYPTTMRASPTTTNSGLGIYLYTGGTVPNYSSYYRTTLTQDQALIGWNMSGGGTNGTFIGVINTGSTTGYLDFSAEL